MEVVGAEVMVRATRKHPDLQGSLAAWLELTHAAEWTSIVDVRAQFPTADGVPLRKGRQIVVIATVFNIGGNKYRLITLIDYLRQLVTVTHVLTHAEYDKEKWKRQLLA